MHLTRLEVQGFKTFAKKTVIDFLIPQKDRNPLTVIVGPNGSGKSNTADAIRWCLGEQSMRQLRGKKSEDLIFSGSKNKSRSGFAEVTMTFNNEDHAMKIDYAEVTITRRFFRDGDSIYLLNGKNARLQDIQLLLAEAGIGQRSYTVIGQGMVDHVLTSSPEERKIFFDDATGVRGLQIKRHQSMLKLKKASENLVEVEMLLAEIEPRLRSLKRQVRKLEKREVIERELHEIQVGYYGTLYWDLQDMLALERNRITEAQEKIKNKQTELKEGDARLLEMEKTIGEETGDNSLMKRTQEEYKKAQQELANARKKQFEAERELELAKVRAQSTWAPLPLAEIIKELEMILKFDETIGVGKILTIIRTLRDRLKKPNPQDIKPDPKLLKTLEVSKEAVRGAESNVKEAEKQIDQANQASAQPKTEIFSIQRQLRQIQSDLNALEYSQNEVKIELARIETRIDGLVNEMKEEVPMLRNDLMAAVPKTRISNADETRGKILRLKHELELIGAIDQ
ncbi:MAG: AAA family ATPase, partial [Patescibacteria group bacterium]